jgi:hypothetical protein
MLRGGQRRIYIVYSGFADVPPVKFRGILFPINWTVAFNYSNRIIFAKTIIDHNNLLLFQFSAYKHPNSTHIGRSPSMTLTNTLKSTGINPSRIHLDMAYMGLRFPETQGDIKILFNLS